MVAVQPGRGRGWTGLDGERGGGMEDGVRTIS